MIWGYHHLRKHPIINKATCLILKSVTRSLQDFLFSTKGNHIHSQVRYFWGRQSLEPKRIVQSGINVVKIHELYGNQKSWVYPLMVPPHIPTIEPLLELLVVFSGCILCISITSIRYQFENAISCQFVNKMVKISDDCSRCVVVPGGALFPGHGEQGILGTVGDIGSKIHGSSTDASPVLGGFVDGISGQLSSLRVKISEITSRR